MDWFKTLSINLQRSAVRNVRSKLVLVWIIIGVSVSLNTRLLLKTSNYILYSAILYF
jgi:hypothetical protein